MIMVKRFLVIFAFALPLTSAAYSQDFSIKNRWNLRLNYSLHKTTEIYPLGTGLNIPRSNYRIECNYGVLDWLEVGAYVGVMHYRMLSIADSSEITLDNLSDKYKKLYAPQFGVNANIHILPFFVKNPDCKWDLYVPVRYGGTYLVKWLDEYGLILRGNKYEELMAEQRSNQRYKSQFGAGIGGTYYIENVVGIFVEVLGGQFSYVPRLIKQPIDARIGISVKF